MKTINERISENIVVLRKNAKLTQLEFAEKINYSDKAVSKWENGDSIPSVEVLEKICICFNVTLNDLVSENPIKIETKQKFKLSSNKLIIICLCMMSVWLLATTLFVYSNLLWNTSAWIVFVWAIPASCLIGIIFNSIWGIKKNIFYLFSILVWTMIAGFYLTFLSQNAWVLFLLGIPLQIALILWSQLGSQKTVRKKIFQKKDKTNKPTKSNKKDKED